MKLPKSLIFLTYKLPRNIILALALIYTLVGFFILPLVIKSQSKKFILENYKESLQVEKINFNPYTFELVVENLDIPDSSAESADKSRLKFKKLLLNLEILPLLSKKITFKEVSFDGAHIYLSFYKNQKNNWSTVVKEKERPKETSSSSWTLVLEKISFTEDYFQFRDFNYPTPVHLPFGPLSLKAHEVSTKLGTQSSLDNLFINLGEQGNLQLHGKVGLTPPSADIKIVANKFPLNFLTAYLSQSTYLEIGKGLLDINARLTYDKSVIKLKGDAKVQDFLLRKTLDKTEVLGIKQVDFSELNYSSKPNSLSLASIDFSELSTYVLLNPDGTLNFKELIHHSEKKPAESQKKSEPMSYSIESIKFMNSKLSFKDWQIKPKFEAHIHDLNGELGPVSNHPSNKININLAGMVEEQGKFTSKGFYFQNKKPMELNLGVSFSNIEMTTFTPYSGYFAGYEIKKGKLFLDLKYGLKNNHILGRNSVRLDQFTLGEKVESKNATNLPLKFALALLKDRKGQIKFNLPVEGNTDTPKFSYGSAIRTALYNMIINIVSAPFDFLSSLVGAGPELKLVEFENQTAIFKAANDVKIDQVAKLMEERPDLKLEILGTCSEKEFLSADNKVPPVIEEAKYKEIGLQRAQLIQNLLVKKNINAERLYVMAGKKNDDSIGPSGAILIFKQDL